MRLALDAATSDPTRVDRGIMAAGRLFWFWLDSGRAMEGYEYTRQLLARAGGAVSPASRAQALLGAGLLAWHLGIRNLDEARELLEEAVAIQRELGDDRVLAHFVSALARPVRDQGNRTRARRLLAESLQLAESSGNWQTVARSYHETWIGAARARGFRTSYPVLYAKSATVEGGWAMTWASRRNWTPLPLPCTGGATSPVACQC